MKFTFKVDIGDGPFNVTTKIETLVAWERKYKTKMSNLGNGVGIEDMAFLAYTACKENKIVVPAVFDDFVGKLATLELVETEAERPTHAAPTGDN